ncbi:MAG: colanic acid biosynthesis glycosyltransferase WcaL [Calditrichaeota bacterium]|nr:MAG: colanic acid biosynthesis glycosyltransferase WcaL [Calditrichota bacterium]
MRRQRQHAARKLGYFLSGFPRLSETFVLNEILELERLGTRVAIFSLKRGAEPHLIKLPLPVSQVVYVPQTLRPGFVLQAIVAGLSLLLVAPLRRARVMVRFFLSGKKERYYSLPMSALRWLWLCGQLRAYGIERVHAHFAHDPSTMAYWIKQMLGCTYSFTAHAKDIYCYSSAWLKEKIHEARFVVTCTEYNKQFLLHLSQNGTPVHCIYHGVDVRRFTPRARKPMATPWILSVGRLVEKKGFSTLLQACALLQARRVPFTCQIVGDGPLFGVLRKELEKLGLQGKVQLPGKKTQDELVEYYQRAALFVLPCCVTEDGDRDGIPNVVLEAMAMELPVVTTRISGLPEAVAHGSTGLLVQEKNSRELADAMETLIRDPALAAQMGRAGRQRILERYELKRNVQSLKDHLFS